MSKVSEKQVKLEQDLFEMEYYGYVWHKDGTEVRIDYYKPEDGLLPPLPPFDIIKETTFHVAQDTDIETTYIEILTRMHKMVKEGASQSHYREHRFKTFNYTLWTGRAI